MLATGVYAPSSEMFVEQSSRLLPFAHVSVNASERRFQCTPVVEAPTFDVAAYRKEYLATLAAADAARLVSFAVEPPTVPAAAARASTGSSATSRAAEPRSSIVTGSFVFLRNGRFNGSAPESTAMPKYWVGRVTPAVHVRAGLGTCTVTVTATVTAYACSSAHRVGCVACAGVWRRAWFPTAAFDCRCVHLQCTSVVYLCDCSANMCDHRVLE